MANILLIDDSMLARNLLRLILENAGYTICGEAPNGKEGLEKYKQLKPDLVFCDIMMDEMNGLECMRAILSVNPDANVVILTSVGDELHLDEAIKSGAKGFHWHACLRDYAFLQKAYGKKSLGKRNRRKTPA